MASHETSDEQRFARALLRRAEEDRRRMLAAAEADAARLREEAARQLDGLRAERLDAARRRARTRLAVRLSDERCRQQGQETRLLDEASRRAFELAAARLERLREQPDYTALVGRLIDEGMAEAGVGEGQSMSSKLIVDARDRDRALAELARRGLTMAVEAGGPFLGGVKLVAGDGRVVVDNTFEARLRARSPAILTRLAQLFSGSTAPAGSK